LLVELFGQLDIAATDDQQLYQRVVFLEARSHQRITVAAGLGIGQVEISVVHDK